MELLPHLETAADSAPEGKPRWSCLCYLAAALMSAGRPDVSLRFYEQAAMQALAATEAEGENGRSAWSDVAWITGTWAIALVQTGDLDGSAVTGDPATDTLFVAPAPMLTKEFLDSTTLDPDPIVGTPGSVVIRFTIQNTSPDGMATDISFVDELTTKISETPVAIPERRPQFDRLAISRDSFVKPANGF